MRKGLSYILIATAAAGFSSCSLDNDMRLPKTPADFTAFEIDGQTSAKIDTRSLTVSVVLSEDVEINDLSIKTVRYTEGARCSDPSIAEGKSIDLSTPVQVTLTIFRDYLWTISATQPVSRYIECENQVGEAIIHEDTRTVNVTVQTDKKQYIDSRTALVINDMKLEIKGSEIISTTGMEVDDATGEYTEVTRDMTGFPVTLDCFLERTFTVRLPDGTTTEWRMIVLPDE